MTQTFIPGYEITFTIDGDSTLTLAADTVALAYGNATLPKPVFGAQAQQAISGQASGTFNASGHGSVEVLPALTALRGVAGGQPVDVVIFYGGVGGPVEGGSDAVAVVIGEVTLDASADGQLSWSLAGLTSETAVYTPPAP